MNLPKLLVEPNPVVARLSPYAIDRPRGGVDLVLDFNESLVPPPSLVGCGVKVNRYPVYDEIEAAIAGHFNVARERVLVTNGADDGLERAVRASVGPGRRAVLTTPSYGMIRRFAVLAGAEVVETPWWDGDFPVDEVCRLAGDGGGLVVVVSPSNPTGAIVSRSTFKKLLDRLPRSLVLLDQAYVDFADHSNDVADLASEFPNAVVVRTFSKAWGCAGLRVGWAIGDPRVIDWMRRSGLPFPVTSPSIEAVTSVLSEGPDRRRISAVRDQREKLADMLIGLGVQTLHSEASFVFARFRDDDLAWRGLGTLGISVRSFPDREDLLGWLRITLPGDKLNFERLTRGLATVLSPEALLFDMDGVLADVSRSYRRAIIETAALWNVELLPDDVARAKAEGNAANDWLLTRRLLAERGVEADLDEVTARFEAVYQGSDDEPGLRRFESLRVDRESLIRMAANRPLGVVTGRPRSDAERFLDEHGVADLFSAVVCMQDAAPKPDPEPVRLALERLGVSTAWLVGDTKDDMRAARGAGVLPIGLVAVGDDPASTRDVLEEAGAAKVIHGPRELEEMLQ